jgi:hypothetical protein
MRTNADTKQQPRTPQIRHQIWQKPEKHRRNRLRQLTYLRDRRSSRGPRLYEQRLSCRITPYGKKKQIFFIHLSNQ